MRVLFDTNVLIYREDYNILPNSIQRLQKILNEINNVKVLIHPSSLEEIEHDKNENRKRIIRSKVCTYSLLEAPPRPENDYEYLGIVGSEARINSKIDAKILYSVYKNAVDFLITEDRGIHKRARQLGIEDNVLLVEDALQIFEKYVRKDELVSPPALKNIPVHNLNLNDPIFDSLKEEYEEFSDWFMKISKEGRMCWVHYRDNDAIGAILIYKDEDEPIPSIPPFPKNKRFKICLFKVTDVGHKIGELFIKLSIDYCIKNDVPEMYLTHFTEAVDPLVELISEYGFLEVAENQRGEKIFMKNLIPDRIALRAMTPTKIIKDFYPNFYDGPKVGKFIVPIHPKWHDKLFTDFPGRKPRAEEINGEFIVEGNAIKKAYLSHSPIKKIKPGDILLFYRTNPFKEITTLGTVESVHPEIEDEDQIFKLVAKRTVYYQKEIQDMKKPILIILFRHHFHLKNYIALDMLKKIGVLSGPPQSIVEISHEDYIRIRERGDIDERYTVN